MTSLDREAARATEALVYRLKHRDPEEDDEVFARGYVTALLGNGWRPVEALAPWERPQTGAPSSEETRREILGALRAERGWGRDTNRTGDAA